MKAQFTLFFLSLVFCLQAGCRIGSISITHSVLNRYTFSTYRTDTFRITGEKYFYINAAADCMEYMRCDYILFNGDTVYKGAPDTVMHRLSVQLLQRPGFYIVKCTHMSRISMGDARFVLAPALVPVDTAVTPTQDTMSVAATSLTIPGFSWEVVDKGLKILSQEGRISNIYVFDLLGRLMVEERPLSISYVVDSSRLPADGFVLVLLSETGTALRQKILLWSP